MTRSRLHLIGVLAALAIPAGWLNAEPPGKPIVLNDDGAWCWFQDERAIIAGTRLIVGSVANGSHDSQRKGDIDLTMYDLECGSIHRQTLHHQLEADDHVAPALWRACDGRVIAAYSKHGSENCFYVCATTSAPNLTHWTAAKQIVPSDRSRITYSNLHFLSAEKGRLYNFFRGLDSSFKPSYAWSDDLGASWQTGNVVIDVPAAFRHRPYVKYASNGRDSIHLLYTDGHPRDFDNSVYHVFYRGGLLHRSDGTVIGSLTKGLQRPEDGTCVFVGDSKNVAWVSDLHLSPDGRPYAVFTVQKDSGGLRSGDAHAGQDHRYHYAWWDGHTWHDHELAFGGTRLYAGEDDYTGNICLDPDRLDTVYFSTNAEPQFGAPLISKSDGQRHFELYRAVTANGGNTWDTQPVTHDSLSDNLRPLVPDWDGQHAALLWFRGVYRAYRDYQTEIVGLFSARHD